ncbi:MAG TPA: hypothetical protein VGI39_31620 [Polyangiaceae bacterium]|jgi:hypothetical protein
MAATVTPLGRLVMESESIPWGAAVAPLAPPPFDAATPFRITTAPAPDGCPQVAPGRTIHLHMTGANVRGLCYLPDYPSSPAAARIAFVETCFHWAPILKRMTAAARLAFTIASAQKAIEAIGGTASELLARIYDIVEPRAIVGWEGVLGDEIPESAEDFAALVGSPADERRVTSALGVVHAAFSIGQEIAWVDLDDTFAVGALVVAVGLLAALGVAPPAAQPFLQFPLAAGYAGPEEREHLRHVLAAGRERGYRG